MFTKTISKEEKNVKHNTWKIIQKVIFWILLVIFVIQLALSAMVAIRPQLILHTVPIRILEVTSDSMYPKFHTGDGLILGNTKYEDLQVGDIISYYQSGDLVTHEIVEIGNDGTITTEGLANGIPDNPITKEQYVGKVRVILPGFSWFLSLSYGPVRKAIWIALIIVICFGTEIFSWVYDKIEKAISAKRNINER